MERFEAVAIIPTYNNVHTVAGVIEALRPHIAECIVINDGSTDETAQLLGSLPVDVITVAANRGKGHALRLGFARAIERGFTHAITVDADGQHSAADAASLLEKARREPAALWIGNRVLDAAGAAQPARSKFGARFGAFWYRFHTRLRIDDTQCGLRAYPLHRIAALRCRGDRYEYEIDVLIRAAWARIPVKQTPVSRYYLPAAQRVSHFRPIRDFARISLVNSRAALTRLLMPWRFLDAPGVTAFEKIRFLVIREITSHHSPRRASAALALGACIGLSPIHGFQVLTAMGLSVLLRLNRTLAFVGVAISSPPFLPFWIAGGYAIGTRVIPTALLARTGARASRAGLHTLGALLNPGPEATRAALIALQWAVGSTVMAVAVGVLVFAVTCPLFCSLNKRSRAKNTAV